MARGFYNSKNLTKDTLLAIAAIGAVVLVATMSPNFFPVVAREYFKDKRKKAMYARARKLRELEKKKLISFQELKDGEVRIELTHRGKVLVRQYELDEIKFIKPTKWDGRWHVFMYDIPSSKRKASNAFRSKIRQLGLFQLQKSVWIFPYNCMPEIEFIATVFEIDINEHVFHLTTKEIPKEREVKDFFEV